MEDKPNINKSSLNDKSDSSFQKSSVMNLSGIRLKKKKKLGQKRCVSSKLNRSNLSANGTGNSSHIRQGLRMNNRQLALALEGARKTISILQQQNIELQRENQELVTKYNSLKHVAGLGDDQIDAEVEKRFQDRMILVKEYVNKMNAQLTTAVDFLADIVAIAGMPCRFSLESSHSHRNSSLGNPTSTMSTPSQDTAMSPDQPCTSTQQSVSADVQEPSPSQGLDKFKEITKVPEAEEEMDTGHEEIESAGPMANDLSIIAEQSLFLNDSIAITRRMSRGDRQSRSNRRSAMLDFSTLQEFQSQESEKEVENTLAETGKRKSRAEVTKRKDHEDVEKTAPRTSRSKVQSRSQVRQTTEEDLELPLAHPEATGNAQKNRDNDKKDLHHNEEQESHATSSKSQSQYESDTNASATENKADGEKQETARHLTVSKEKKTTGKEKRQSSANRKQDKVKNKEAPQETSQTHTSTEISDQEVPRRRQSRRGTFAVQKPVSTNETNQRSESLSSERDKQEDLLDTQRSRRGTFTIPSVPIHKSPKQQDKRRETYAVPRASEPPVCKTPENKQNDRRGTFVVPKAAAEQAQGPTCKARRGTFNVKNADDDGILQENADVLLERDMIPDDMYPESEDSVPARSPVRSSIASSTGDVTICEELDMDFTKPVDASRIPVPSFVTNDVHEATFLQEVEHEPEDPFENPEKCRADDQKQKASNASPKAANRKKESKAEKTSSTSAKTIKKNENTNDKASTTEEKSSNVYKAWCSKPGNITFTSGRKDLAAMAKERQKSRSKQKSMLPKKPRSKSSRSKTRVLPDHSPKTVFDFAGTPRNQPEKGEKSIYDMSLNESMPVSKKSYKEFKGQKPDDVNVDKQKESQPNLKRVKEMFANRDLEDDTTDSHGIMLVLGNGKRTKPRSKKQVSYSGPLPNVASTPVYVCDSPVADRNSAEFGMLEGIGKDLNKLDAGKTPPSRRQSKRISSDSGSDTNHTPDVPMCIPDSPDQPVEQPPATEAPSVHEESTHFEDNVKIIPNAAPTPSPLKKLMSKKFSSTEEEMRALFESSLMGTPRQPQKTPVGMQATPLKSTDPVEAKERTGQDATYLVPPANIVDAETGVADNENTVTHVYNRTDDQDNIYNVDSTDKVTTKNRKGTAAEEAALRMSGTKESTKASKSSKSRTSRTEEVDTVEDRPVEKRGRKRSKVTKEATKDKAETSPLRKSVTTLEPGSQEKKTSKSSKSSQAQKAKETKGNKSAEKEASSQDTQENVEAQQLSAKKPPRKPKTSQGNVASSPSRKRSADDHVFAIPEGSPPKRSRRAASSVSYKEPSLNCKMRRGEPGSNTIFINNVQVKKIIGDNKETEKSRVSITKSRGSSGRRRTSEQRAILSDISNDSD